jgi:hypothetical protein
MNQATMSTDQTQEIEALRAQVSQLQKQAAAPSVRVEGFEGLEELSQAIERNDLAGFIQDRAQPVWLQWAILALVAIMSIGIWAAVTFYRP